jgi:succinate-semialdehyde dehydrogenase / glutarate-semialdehyde dehydrogenase
MALKKNVAKKRRINKKAARTKPRRSASSKQGVKKMNVRALKTARMPKKIQSINPYTEQVMKEYHLLSEQEINREISQSREAFSAWRAVPIVERASYIKLLARQLRAEKRTYAELITKEMGKPAGLCDYYAEHAPTFLETEHIKTEALKSYVTFEPLGIVLAIMPWNFPFWQALRFGIPAIIAGNVVVLKHASNVPQTALAIEDAFKKTGFPDHVFRTLLIDAKDALNLIDEDKVDAVSLTGSNKAGEEVGAHAGGKVKKVVLELGGSDPFIVLDDADIEKAGRMAVNARMINTGQSCIAAKRFIVMETVAEEFKKQFVARLKELKMGDPLDESTDVGTVAKPDILQALNEQLRDAKAKGAEVVQTERVFKKGLFFAPSAVYNPTKKMKVLTEEVFGPIAPIIVVKDEDEAVRVANDTEFGLGASIWSRNHARAEKLATKLEAGTIAINDMVKSDARLPFGGVKKSGFGRELSHYGLREFVNVKSVVVRE